MVRGCEREFVLVKKTFMWQRNKIGALQSADGLKKAKTGPLSKKKRERMKNESKES